LVRPNPENARRILEVLSQFGFGKLGIEIEDLETPGKVVQLGIQPNRKSAQRMRCARKEIDLVTALSGLSFEEAWASREAAHLDGVPVEFIGRTALIRNKEREGPGRRRRIAPQGLTASPACAANWIQFSK
jgi:hypothetical protein